MNGPDEILVKALRQILKPLVRLMVRKNVTLKPFIDLVKEAYVHVAEEDLAAEGQKVTDSHISLVTGVHRKDVRHYRSTPLDEDRMPRAASIGAQLLAEWMGNPDLCDKKGHPLPLAYLHRDGVKHSFVSLVEGISKDIRARPILDEFIRQGLVEFDEAENSVALISDAFIPSSDWEEKVHFMGRNTSDHIAAATHNVLGGKPAFFDRSVFYDDLTKESVQELQKLSADMGMEMLQKINKKAFELSEKDKKKGSATWRMNLGAYFYGVHEDAGKE